MNETFNDRLPRQRINLWSGPRNVSTALMYSFAQRSDTRVVDEPLYAHYLHVSNAPHPGRDEVITSMEKDGEQVIQTVLLGPADRPVLFCKQMAHHLVQISRDFLAETTNILLIRDPVQMLPSLEQNLPNPSLRDTGLALQSELYAQLCQLGQRPVVLDAKELLLDPRSVLQQLCTALDLPFAESMLHWSAGARPEDGIWAKYWYQSVHCSTGFSPYQEKREPFPTRLQSLLAECQPHYARLFEMAIRA